MFIIVEYWSLPTTFTHCGVWRLRAGRIPIPYQFMENWLHSHSQ